ncbi:MAG: flagellar hook-length control protein FliK, partial [Candidatus Poribacteria bacterium]|nr:flagellar hook-length control protein FliK [Candidatus Poribacteria bacterium]
MAIQPKPSVNLLDILRNTQETRSPSQTQATKDAKSGEFRRVFQIKTGETSGSPPTKAAEQSGSPPTLTRTEKPDKTAEASLGKSTPTASEPARAESSSQTTRASVSSQPTTNDAKASATTPTSTSASSQTVTTADGGDSATSDALKLAKAILAGETIEEPKGVSAKSSDESASTSANQTTKPSGNQPLMLSPMEAASLKEAAKKSGVSVLTGTNLPQQALTEANVAATSVASFVGGDAPLDESIPYAAGGADETLRIDPDTLDVVIPATISPRAQSANVSQFARATATSGQEFPSVSRRGENISTEGLLRALEQEVLASSEQLSDARNASRQGVLIDSPGEVVDEVSLRAQAAQFRSNTQFAVDPRAARQARMLGGDLLAAQTRQTQGGVGTLSASNASRSMDAHFQSARALTGRTTGQEDSPRFNAAFTNPVDRSTLQSAQTILSRRAAFRAFGGDRSQLVDAEPNPIRQQAVEHLMREYARTQDASSASFVRQSRDGRMKAPSAESASGFRSDWSDYRAGEHNAQAASGVNAQAAQVAQASPNTTTAAHQGYSPLIEYLAQESRKQVRLGKREFRIHMNPESMGSVDLEVVMEGNSLVLKLTAASKETQELLEEHIGELADAL